MMAAGIETRHARTCRSGEAGARCNCLPTYRARIWNGREGKRELKTFKSLSEAKTWRQDATVAIRQGTYRRPSPVTVQVAGENLIAGMRSGVARNRSGEPYKPSAVRGYERSLRLRVFPRLGARRLSEVRRRDVLDLIEAMQADGCAASTIRNTLDPLRVIYRRAVNREDVTTDPLHRIDVPSDRGRRDRFAMPEEAAALIAALGPDDQALWATAFYTALRRGELRELRCSDYDRATHFLRVERALDDAGDVILTKTYAADRDVPVIPTLRRVLQAHLLRTGRRGDDLMFGRTASEPFVPSTVRRRVRMAWQAAGLEPITLHEARHSTATMLNAAGINLKLISAIVGHASVAITQDRYTHIGPEHLAEAGAKLDAYLSRDGRAETAG